MSYIETRADELIETFEKGSNKSRYIMLKFAKSEIQLILKQIRDKYTPDKEEQTGWGSCCRSILNLIKSIEEESNG